LLGTPQYTAPEQAMQAKSADQRSDVWGLCISMYEALSGRRPWSHCETLAQLLLAICTESIPPLSAVAPWVDPSLAAVIHRGLERDRERRHASVDALLAALEPFAGGSDVLESGMLVEAQVSSQDLTRVMRIEPGLQALAAPPPALPAARKDHRVAGSASLDALAASAAEPSFRSPWLVSAGVLVLLAGVGVGMLVFRPRGEDPRVAASTAPVPESSPPSASVPPASAASSTPTSASPEAASSSPGDLPAASVAPALAPSAPPAAPATPPAAPSVRPLPPPPTLTARPSLASPPSPVPATAAPPAPPPPSGPTFKQSW